MKTILVPTNFSVYATDAAVTAVSILRATGGKLIMMHNVETLLTNWSHLPETEQSQHPEIRSYSEMVYRDMQQIVKGEVFDGITVEPIITYGVTSDEILRTALETGADLIVMGSADKNVGHDFIGSTLQHVVRQAPCPVLSIKKEIGSAKWTRVLVPLSLDFDISIPFEGIAGISKDLASEIQLLYVNTPQHFKDGATIKKRMNEFKVKYPMLRIEAAVYDHTEIEEGILEFAKSSHADCIAMITFEHKHTPGYQLSVTDHILYHATVPVLAVYEGAALTRRTREII